MNAPVAITSAVPSLAPEATKQIHENLKKINELRGSMNGAGRELIVQMREAGTAVNKLKTKFNMANGETGFNNSAPSYRQREPHNGT